MQYKARLVQRQPVLLSLRLGCAFATQGEHHEEDGHVSVSTGQYHDAPRTWAAVSIPVQVPQVDIGDKHKDRE